MFGRSVKVGLNLCSKMRFTGCFKRKKVRDIKRRCFSATAHLTNETITSSANNIFAMFAKDLSNNPICEHYPDMRMRFIGLVEYPSKVGSKKVPCTTFMCYKILEKPEKLTEENVILAQLLGWFGEMLQVIIFMNRDTIDDLHPRYDTITWYSHLDVGLQVGNDCVILETSIFLLLRKYFKNHRNYIKLVDLIHSTLRQSFDGHNLELIAKDVDKFNMDLIERIAKYKIASGCFILPLLSALYLTELDTVEDLDATKNILNDVGSYKKVESDFMDSFGPSPKYTNIKLGYCSWLATRTVEKANGTQKAILKKNYGISQISSVQKVNSLYKELDLSSEFQKYKTKKFEDIQQKLEKLKDERFRNCVLQIVEDAVNC